MATRFQRPHDTSLLSEEERLRFYETMKATVVGTQSLYKRNKKYGGSANDSAVFGSGFIISRDGHILTSHENVLQGETETKIRLYGEVDFRPAKVVYLEPQKNLAILQPIQPAAVYKFVDLYGGEVRVGMQVYSIGHPDDLVYSLVEGQVAFSCKDVSSYDKVLSSYQKDVSCRYVGDIKRLSSTQFQQVDDDVPLIQINNIHGSEMVLGYNSSYGAPVFIANGQVIGMCVCCFENYDFAMHHHEIRKCIKKLFAGENPEETSTSREAKNHEEASKEVKDHEEGTQ